MPDGAFGGLGDWLFGPAPIGIGDFCRVHTAPARSIGRGLGVYVSAQSGYELCVGRAEPATGNEKGFPHALDFEVDILAACAKHGHDDRRFRALLNKVRQEELVAAGSDRRNGDG